MVDPVHQSHRGEARRGEARHAQEPEQLLLDIADTISRTGALLAETTSVCVVLSPEHAALVAVGWARDDVRRVLVAEATVHPERLRAVGKSALSHRSRFRIPDYHPDAIEADEGTGPVPALAGEGAVHVIVAGAPNAGVSSVVNLYGTGNTTIRPKGIR